MLIKEIGAIIIKRKLMLKASLALGMGALGLAVATTSADAATVKVQAGDTLWGYSLQYKVPVAEIMQVNHLTNPNVLQVGQILEIPTEGDLKKGTSEVIAAPTNDVKRAVSGSQANQPLRAGMPASQSVSFKEQQNAGGVQLTTGQSSRSQAQPTVLTNGQTGSRMTTTNVQANHTATTSQASFNGGNQAQSAPAATGNAATAVARAQSAIGTPYVYGGNTPAGFDCSGLIQWAYGLGPEYRTTYQQTNLGAHQYDVYNAPAGALVFFGSDQAPYHAGISVGNASYIQAPVPGQSVKTTHMSYYTPNYYINMN